MESKNRSEATTCCHKNVSYSGQQKNLNLSLSRDMNSLTKTAFPKKCSNCGMVYLSSDEFLNKTSAPPGKSGLKSGEGEDGAPIVELFRNCVCGSTLMEFYRSRRDMSKAGAKRRKTFGKLMRILEQKGLAGHQAREELLKVLRGEESDSLKQMGFRFR